MDAEDEEVASLATSHRQVFFRSLAHLMQRVAPVDISGEDDRIDEDLRQDEELDLVISDLDGGHRKPAWRMPARLSRAQGWLFAGVAVLIVLGVLATWLFVAAPWQDAAGAQNNMRVLFSTTDLGSLYQPAWADDARNAYAVGSSGTFIACSHPITAPGICGQQYLSLGDDGGNLYRWDQSSDKIVKELNVSMGAFPGDTAFHWHWLYPGRYLISDEQISGLSDIYRLWDVVHNSLLFTATLPSSFPARVAPFVLSADGWLAAFTPPQTVKIWNTNLTQPGSQATFTLSSPYFAHLIALAWSPDGSQLATVSSDGTIQVWEPRTSALPFPTLHLARNANARPLNSVRLVWSPDDQRLASAIVLGTQQTPVQIWDLQTGHLLQSYNREPVNPATLTWLDHGVEMLSGDIGDNVQVWNSTTGRVITSVQWQIGAVALMPRSAQLQISPDRHWLILPQTYGIQIIDLQSGKLLRTLPIKDNALLLDITLAPDRIHLATVDQYGQIQVWNIQTGQVMATYKLPVSFVSQVETYLSAPGGWSVPVDLAWSLNSQLLAVTYQGGGLVVLGLKS